MGSRKKRIGSPAPPRDAGTRSRGFVVACVIAVVVLIAFVVTTRVRRIERDPRLSVLLITIDTLRADALGAYGGRAETPWIDRLAKEGARFDDAHAHNVVTFPSHANILSGQLPLTHGVHDNTGFRFPQGLNTMATRLKALGFRTGAFVSAFVLDSRFGLDRGFDVYDDRATGIETQSPFRVPDRKGVDTVAAARAWIDAQGDAQSFAWVHLYEPHFPYLPPEPFRTRYADEPYAGEVAAADAALESLLSPLLEKASTRNVMVILTADHGEGLGDHQETTHGVFAYESTLHVPLILWSHTIRPSIVKGAVRHIDLVPTLLDALGQPADPTLPGRSLLPLIAKEEDEAPSSYFESLSASLNQGWAPLRGILDGRLKYIDLPLPELYDLAKDPKETKNLAATEPQSLDRLKAKLAREREKDRGSKRGEEDAAALEKLRALGYAAAGSVAPAKDVYTAEDDPKNLIAIDERNRRVVTLFNQGGVHLNEAIDLLKKNLAERPDMAGANLQLAYLERAQGRLAAAVTAARRAVELKPLDGEAVALLGAYLTESGRPAEALRVLEPYARVGAVNFDVFTAIGLAHSALGHFAEARGAFVSARDLDPASGLASANLGVLELMAGNRDAARAALDHAIELDPDIAKAHNTLGVMSAQEGRREEAIAFWRRAVEINPSDYQILFNLASTFEAVGRSGEARAYYEQYVRAAPPGLESRDIARVRAWLRAHP